MQKVKQNEFHAYDLILDQPQKRKTTSGRETNLFIIGLSATLIILVVAIVAYFQLSQDFQPLNEEKLAYEIPEEPYITVTEFQNLNPSDETNYLRQSITENIVSVLSRSRDRLVMAPGASSAAQSENPQIKEIANSVFTEMQIQVAEISRADLSYFKRNED